MPIEIIETLVQRRSTLRGWFPSSHHGQQKFYLEKHSLEADMAM
jgi:hypothetical protein